LVEELIELVGDDAEALGCRRELAGLRRIAAEGTSAMRQRAVFADAGARGLEPPAALSAVVDALAAEFLGE
jgi:glutamate---cysteine ligase / carboxylate-amine ligase